MPKYMVLYTGPATAPEDMTEEAVQTEMKLWGEWMEGVGSALTEVGAPTGASGVVTDDGSEGRALQVTGYSVLEADDIEGVKELVRGHPYIRDGEGTLSISIHELLPTPEM
jgi:hypothetical protein